MNTQLRSFATGPLAGLILLYSSNSVEAAEAKLGWNNESEAGIVVTSGNAKSETFSFRQLNERRWEKDLLRFDGRYLRTSSRGVDSAKSWGLLTRYERGLAERLSGYAGLGVESDVFSGFLQRWNIDAGGKYFFLQEEDRTVALEGGYRRAIENRFSGQVSQNLIRAYVEGSRDWTKTFSTRAGIEYLPNLTISSDYQLNVLLAASAAMSDVFALKVGYDVRYRAIPVAPAVENTDSQFTTAIVAKF